MNKIFELLLQNFDKIGQQANPDFSGIVHDQEWFDRLKEKQLFKLADSYSATALERMAAARGYRGGKANRATLAAHVMRHFYDLAAIKKTIDALSGPAREALYRLKLAGGQMSLPTWRSQMQARYNRETMQQVQAELVGGAIALYAYKLVQGIEFSSGYKHELTGVGLSSEIAIIWSFPKALNLFVPTPAEIKSWTSGTALKPYQPGSANLIVAQEASFNILLTDLMTFLRYIEQNKVRLLVAGEIGKRDYDKLKTMLTPVKPYTATLYPGKGEMGRLNFLWHLLLETKLVVFSGDNEYERYVKVNPVSSQEFYNLPRYRQARLLTAAWIRSRWDDFRRIPTLTFNNTSASVSDIPSALRLVVGRAYLLGWLSQANPAELEGWLDYSSLLTAIRTLKPDLLIPRRDSEERSYDYSYNYQGYYGPRYYNGFDSLLKQTVKSKGGYNLPSKKTALQLGEDWELVEGEWIAELMTEPLAWLGLVELGLNEQARPLAFRLTEMGRAVLTNQPTPAELEAERQSARLATGEPDLLKALLVQPNFDLMVLAPLQHMTLLRQVDRFANQTSMGDVAMYRLTKETVLRGLRNGLTGPDIVRTLEENSRVPVAQNITATILDWSAQFERLVIRRQATLLETPTPELLDRMMLHPESAGHLVKRLGPTFALVQGEPAVLQKLLARLSSQPAKNQPLLIDRGQRNLARLEVEGDKIIKVLPGQGEPDLYFRLGRFAELVSWDPAQRSAVFRLTARAAERARAADLTYDAVARFLLLNQSTQVRGRFSQPAALPPLMELILKGWLGYYSPVTAEPSITITVTQRGQLDEIFAIPEFAPALLSRADAHTALVRQSHFEAFRARLAEIGMPVMAPGESESPAPPEPAAQTPEAVAPTKTRRGRQPKSDRAATRPKESAADRDRHKREKEESQYLNQERGWMLPGASGGPGSPGWTLMGPGGANRFSVVDLSELMQAFNSLSQGSVSLINLDDEDANELYEAGDDPDDPLWPPPGRSRRARPK